MEYSNNLKIPHISISLMVHEPYLYTLIEAKVKKNGFAMAPDLNRQYITFKTTDIRMLQDFAQWLISLDSMVRV